MRIFLCGVCAVLFGFVAFKKSEQEIDRILGGRTFDDTIDQSDEATRRDLLNAILKNFSGLGIAAIGVAVTVVGLIVALFRVHRQSR